MEEQPLQDFLDSLHKHPDAVFIVEGKHDVEALKEQGVQNIQRLNTNLYLLAEKVAKNYTQAIILTDLDVEGKKLYTKLRHYLGQLGVHIIDEPRTLLTKTTLTQLEGLSNHIRRASSRMEFHHA